MDNSESPLAETIKTIVIAVLAAALIRTIFFQPFWIPSASMKPNLLVGDFLFVNKMAYGYSQHSCPYSMCSFLEGRIWSAEPERGDVVVFKNPRTRVDFIKRVIGLPGDRIQLKAGVLYINDRAVPQTANGTFTETFEMQGPMRAQPSCANGNVPLGGSCAKEQYLETLENGRSYNILNIRDGQYTDDTPVFVVPEKTYFFLGDNRDNSGDSRTPQLGMVPEKYLIGRAGRIIFSSSGSRMLFFWTWRSDRFFKGLS